MPPLETIAQREALLLAPYAMHTCASAERRYPEPVHPYRGAFQRDRDRILHSAAFRRLSHKTQVFTGELGDYHRSRLTHTLEVSSIARTVGRALKLNEDLIEALALAHDLGHPPFGHAGEDTLNDCLRNEGGFSHNRQALRICELLESRYAGFPGLNLSLEVLEGQQSRADKETAIFSPLLESQVVDAADSVAYDAHDADDALELGLVTLDELLSVPLWRDAAARVRRRHADLDDATLRRALVHELIDSQVSQILSATTARLAEMVPANPAAVRRLPRLVGPDPAVAAEKQALEKFLYDRVYRHPTVLATRVRVQRSLREMFDMLIARPELLPGSFAARRDSAGAKRSVADYLAGMTDRFALREHRRLCGDGGETTT
ncbi:MAG: deoxyguanosinetriphosphate triphosphohydrolase [Planctomycetia bacterium]|nr:deoxyguanosinetriphosphate triphosphohydrolase [Planctomycetia bacterium]